MSRSDSGRRSLTRRWRRRGGSFELVWSRQNRRMASVPQDGVAVRVPAPQKPSSRSVWSGGVLWPLALLRRLLPVLGGDDVEPERLAESVPVDRDRVHDADVGRAAALAALDLERGEHEVRVGGTLVSVRGRSGGCPSRRSSRSRPSRRDAPARRDRPGRERVDDVAGVGSTRWTRERCLSVTQIARAPLIALAARPASAGVSPSGRRPRSSPVRGETRSAASSVVTQNSPSMHRGMRGVRTATSTRTARPVRGSIRVSQVALRPWPTHTVPAQRVMPVGWPPTRRAGHAAGPRVQSRDPAGLEARHPGGAGRERDAQR